MTRFGSGNRRTASLLAEGEDELSSDGCMEVRRSLEAKARLIYTSPMLDFSQPCRHRLLDFRKLGEHSAQKLHRQSDHVRLTSLDDVDPIEAVLIAKGPGLSLPLIGGQITPIAGRKFGPSQAG